MDKKIKQRIALSLGIKEEEVPETFEEIKALIEKKIAERKG